MGILETISSILEDSIPEINETDNPNGFMWEGQWNAVKWIDGLPYRDVVQCLILKESEKLANSYEIFIATTNDQSYIIPGGSKELNVDDEVQVRAECREEAKIVIKDVHDTGLVSVYKTSPSQLSDKSIAKRIMHGKHASIFVAMYDRPYVGKIPKHLENANIYCNGKFVSLDMYFDKLYPAHRLALVKYFSLNQLKMPLTMSLFKENEYSQTLSETTSIGIILEAKKDDLDLDDFSNEEEPKKKKQKKKVDLDSEDFTQTDDENEGDDSDLDTDDFDQTTETDEEEESEEEPSSGSDDEDDLDLDDFDVSTEDEDEEMEPAGDTRDTTDDDTETDEEDMDKADDTESDTSGDLDTDDFNQSNEEGEEPSEETDEEGGAPEEKPAGDLDTDDFNNPTSDDEGDTATDSDSGSDTESDDNTSDDTADKPAEPTPSEDEGDISKNVNILSLTNLERALADKNLFTLYKELLTKVEGFKKNMIDYRIKIEEDTLEIISSQIDQLDELLREYTSFKYIINNYEENYKNFMLFQGSLSDLISTVSSAIGENSPQTAKKSK